MSARVLWIRHCKGIIPFHIVLIFAVLTVSCKKENPEALFTVSSEAAAIGDSIYFNNLSSDANYYQWSFGDGTFAITKNTSHVYKKSGTYTVTLVAIGKEKSGTMSKDVVVSGEFKIFEGTGISEINLGDTWESVNARFANEDTVHNIDFDGTYYWHLIFYRNKNIAVYFVNFNELDVQDDDQAVEISVVNSYEGYTSKGINLGTAIDKVKAAYGTPEIYEGTDYNVYYYDALGIQFWTSGTSAKVNEIDVYPPSVSNGSKSYEIKIYPNIMSLYGKMSTPLHRFNKRL